MAESVLTKSVKAGEKIYESVRDIEGAKAAIADAVDEGVHKARRAVKRGRDAAEDLKESAAVGIRRHPFQTVAVTFGVGISAGLLLGWLISRRK